MTDSSNDPIHSIARNRGLTYQSVQISGNSRLHLGDVFRETHYHHYTRKPSDGHIYSGGVNISGGVVQLGDINHNVNYGAIFQGPIFLGAASSGPPQQAGSEFSLANGAGSHNRNRPCPETEASAQVSHTALYAWLQPPRRQAPESFSRCAGTNDWLLNCKEFEN